MEEQFKDYPHDKKFRGKLEDKLEKEELLKIETENLKRFVSENLFYFFFLYLKIISHFRSESG